MMQTETLAGFLAATWAVLDAAANGAASPARIATLATLDNAGLPTARSVVLRSFDAQTVNLTCHTDARTPKVAQLRKNPHATLLVWDALHNIQIRMTCDLGVKTGKTVADLWDRVPPASRRGYGAKPAPGLVIGDWRDVTRTGDLSQFAVLTMAVAEIDVLHLADIHRRAKFTRSGDWAGAWLVP